MDKPIFRYLVDRVGMLLIASVLGVGGFFTGEKVEDEHRDREIILHLESEVAGQTKEIAEMQKEIRLANERWDYYIRTNSPAQASLMRSSSDSGATQDARWAK